MDLTAYVEKHEFCFDAVLDENVNNDEVKIFFPVDLHLLSHHFLNLSFDCF